MIYFFLRVHHYETERLFLELKGLVETKMNPMLNKAARQSVMYGTEEVSRGLQLMLRLIWGPHSWDFKNCLIYPFKL